MESQNSFKLNPDQINFTVNIDVINFYLCCETDRDSNARLLEDGFFRTLEDNGLRLLE